MGKTIITNRHFGIILSSIIALHVFLLLSIHFFPYPELFVYPYLTKIGLVPYKEILDQHFPGLMFFPLNLATLGFTTPASFRLLQIGCVLLSHVGILLLTRMLTKNKLKILTVSLLYVIWQSYFEGYTVWIETFITPILLFGCYFLIKGIESTSRRQLVGSGILLGIALVMKQVVLPLILLLGLILWIKKVRWSLLQWIGVGIGIPLVVLGVFVLARGIILDFWYWTVIFNVSVFREMGRKFATPREALTLLAFCSVALGSLLVQLKSKNVALSRLLIGTFFLGSFAFAYARFDFIHLQPLVPFALVLTATIEIKSKRFMLGLLMAYVVGSVIFGARFFTRYWGPSVKFFDQQDYVVFNEVSERVSKGDAVFAFATYPHVYAMTETHPAGNVFVFHFPWFMKVSEKRILAGLMMDKPKVVLRDMNATTDGYNLVTYMPEISRYIERYYKVDEIVGQTEIMIPR